MTPQRGIRIGIRTRRRQARTRSLLPDGCPSMANAHLLGTTSNREDPIPKPSPDAIPSAAVVTKTTSSSKRRGNESNGNWNLAADVGCSIQTIVRPLSTMMKMYQRRVAYQKKYGSTCVPQQWKEDSELAVWVANQRRRCKSNCRIDLLNDINFD